MKSTSKPHRIPWRRVALLLVAMPAAFTWAAHHESEEWIQLFNGRDLDGWTVKVTGYELGENPGDTFRVEDGLLVSTCEEFETFGGRFGHLFYRDSFSRYRIRVEYR